MIPSLIIHTESSLYNSIVQWSYLYSSLYYSTHDADIYDVGREHGYSTNHIDIEHAFESENII